jgi:hypothetical protein
LSAYEESAAEPRRADTVAGFLCALSLTASALALVVRPAVLASTAIAIALIAARMTQTHRVLANLTLVAATLSFFFGMLIAIVTDNALF